MATPAIHYSSLLKDLPAGAWVAISEKTMSVIAYSAEIQTVVERSRQQGETDPLIVRVPELAGTLFL
jgi:hypothetical protein